MLNPFSSKRTIYKLRKKYDRIREKADKKGKKEAFQVLKILDSINPALTQLEEQDLSRSDRNHAIDSVKQKIEQAQTLLKTGSLNRPAAPTRDQRK